MTNEQLERTRMQRLRENLGTKVSDARNYVNRFFGAKVCGKCEGCSGGNCDSCKGKPVVSLWDAANSAPAVEEVQSLEKSVLTPGAEKSNTSFETVQPPTINPANDARTEGPEPSMRGDDSRLIHLSRPASGEITLSRLSGASLLSAGLGIDQADPEKSASPEIRTPAEQVMEVKSGFQEQALVIRGDVLPSDSKTDSKPDPIVSGQIPQNDPKATEKVPIREAKNELPGLTAPVIKQAKTESASSSAIKISLPIHQNRPQTILENPCMQAIIKIKYSGQPRKVEKEPAPARKVQALQNQARERAVKAAIKAVVSKVKTPPLQERPAPKAVKPPKLPQETAAQKTKDSSKMTKAAPKKSVAIQDSEQPKVKPLKNQKNHRESEKSAAREFGPEKKSKKTPNLRSAPLRSRPKKKDDHKLVLLLGLLSRRKRKARRKAG